MPCPVFWEQNSKLHDCDCLVTSHKSEKEFKVILFVQRVLIVEVCFHPRRTNEGFPRLFHSIAQVTPRPNLLVHLQSDVKISHRYESDTKL